MFHSQYTSSHRSSYINTGSFDSAVHISEEAANAATAVPWAIVGSISVAAVLGLGINAPVLYCSSL